MTHKNIITKFMIEYDKANVTSSYPSLTEYEIATILDKAYLALIFQKITGNNVRKSSFESDIKSISDLQQLITVDRETLVDPQIGIADNIKYCNLPDDYLYFVCANSQLQVDGTPMDQVDQDTTRTLPVKLTSHDVASKFFSSASNLPWVKTPVSYIEGNVFYVVYDPIKHANINSIDITYVRQPASFVDNLNSQQDFELSDSVAEELISLAISYALENVESPRLSTHLGIRGLES